MDRGAVPTTQAAGAECIRCGYDLAGLADDGVCPECGLAIARSRERTVLLRSAEDDWVRSVRIGLHRLEAAMTMLFVTVVAIVLLLVPGWWIGTGFSGPVERLVELTLLVAGLVIAGLHIHGCVLLSRSSHGEWVPRPRVRTSMQVCGIALPLAVAITLLPGNWLSQLSPSLRLALFACFQINALAFFFALAAALEHLERRTRWWDKALEVRHRGVRRNLYVLAGLVLLLYWGWLALPRFGLGASTTDWGLSLFGLAYMFLVSAVSRVRRAVADEELVAQALEMEREETSA